MEFRPEKDKSAQNSVAVKIYHGSKRRRSSDNDFICCAINWLGAERWWLAMRDDDPVGKKVFGLLKKCWVSWRSVGSPKEVFGLLKKCWVSWRSVGFPEEVLGLLKKCWVSWRSKKVFWGQLCSSAFPWMSCGPVEQEKWIGQNLNWITEYSDK